MGPTWFKLLLVVFLIVVLFGRGRISETMGDFAKGIKSFKKGLADDEKVSAPNAADDASRADALKARGELRAG